MEKAFCLLCETGCEAGVERALKELNYTVITALSERIVFSNGTAKKVSRPLMPGYVFFTSPAEPDWREIQKAGHVYYPLPYKDAAKELKGGDMRFVQWLCRYNGIIGISKAVQTGKKIKIAEGPLKEYEGNIVKIKARQKCCAVKIDSERINGLIWLSYEVAETPGIAAETRGTDSARV